MEPRDVRAAGAVVTRKGGDVLLVHRPKYDDWSFPKGKLDPGEHVTSAAAREVLEETGVEIRLGRFLTRHTYAVSGGREKNVHYWVGHVLGDHDVSAFPANDEIDRVAWVPVEKAPGKLSYLDDVAVLEHAMTEPRTTRTLVVVRHGRAMKRASWPDEDALRPLTGVGRAQARALVPVLHAYGVARVISSPSVRCARTVRPYADSQVLTVEEWPHLSEEEYAASDLGAAAGHLLDLKEPAVACSHRPVLPGLLEALGVAEEPLAPGEFVAIHHRKGEVLGVERHLVR
jgi:8-oxo-dGTP diphosphatase